MNHQYVPYNTSDNDTPPISQVLIGRHLIFFWMTSHRAVTRLENIRQSNIRRSKKLGILRIKIQNKRIDCKIFELNYGNLKPLKLVQGRSEGSLSVAFEVLIISCQIYFINLFIFNCLTLNISLASITWASLASNFLFS